MAFGLGSDNLTQQIQQNTDNLSASVQNVLAAAQNSAIKTLNVPWTNQTKSRFFPYITIKPERWDQLFPYRLLVIDVTKGNQIVNGNPSTTLKISKDGGRTTLDFAPLGSQWSFQLPITPEDLTITDQFAINTTATLRGVMEEHNGLKFKMITAVGSMGVWPQRESITSPPGSPSILQSIFGGTLEAAGGLVSQVNTVINTATGNHPAAKPVTKRPEVSSAGVTGTGYYSAMALSQFLEQYAEAKKNPVNAGWRLVFDIPKQNTSYVGTPIFFVWKQNKAKPQEIIYHFQFKAWRRLKDPFQSSPTTATVQPLSPGILQRVLNTITNARQVTSSALNLIAAVRSDLETPLNVLRQSSLFVKDLAGAVITAADLPFQLQSDYASSIKDSMNILSESIATVSSDPNVREAIQKVKNSFAAIEGLSFEAVAGGQLGTPAAQTQSLDPANNIFAKPEANFSLMDSVPMGTIALTPVQQNAVDVAIENARETTVDDLKSFRNTIQVLAQQLSNHFGAGSEFYNQVYNLPPPTPRLQPMTLDEYQILKSLYDVIQSYDILTATTDVDDQKRQTNMEYVAGLAVNSDIIFDGVPNSKILVPVPFGLTIEAIAARYLQNPQRWLEIATLNNLRDPYIDENGFQIPLLSNATGRQITVAMIDNLYIGQRVVLASTTQQQSARVILDIDRLSDTSFLLTLDGVADLDNFLLSDAAYLQAYLPGTVNSQQKIFIPSDLAVPNDPNIIAPASTLSDPLVGLSKVDWLLTDSGDIARNSYGDFRFAAGITNLIQALKIKIATTRGSVLLHPEFGLGIRAGIMNSELDIQDIYNSINKLIEEDPRFQGLSGLQISLDGPTLTISMGVTLAGQQGVYPVTFQMAA